MIATLYFISQKYFMELAGLKTAGILTYGYNRLIDSIEEKHRWRRYKRCTARSWAWGGRRDLVMKCCLLAR